MDSRRYKISAIIRLILGALVLLITYTSININEDPLIALSLLFIGVFVLVWGASFFLFLACQKLFYSIKSDENKLKDSYKLSLLFGIFCIINVLLLVGGHWNKLIGFILLIIFILLQIFLFENRNGKTIN